MYKDVLRSIEGISIFPIISLVMFVVFFSAILFLTLRYNRENEAELSVMPLDDQSVDNIDKKKNHNHV